MVCLLTVVNIRSQNSSKVATWVARRWGVRENRAGKLCLSRSKPLSQTYWKLQFCFYTKPVRNNHPNLIILFLSLYNKLEKCVTVLRWTVFTEPQSWKLITEVIVYRWFQILKISKYVQRISFSTHSWFILVYATIIQTISECLKFHENVEGKLKIPWD